MNVQVNPKAVSRIKKSSVLQQTSFWSEFKRKQGIGSNAFALKVKGSELRPGTGVKEYITDDILVLFRKAGMNREIDYVPYGPGLKPGDDRKGPFLEDLSESLRSYLPPDCIMLRYDLAWESPWTGDKTFFRENGDWKGPPSAANQELRLNFDTRNWNLKKANTNILPSDTIFIDLRKDKNTLLREMKAKTRYNIRLTQRKGVTVRAAGPEEIGLWHGLYRETCRRNGIYHQDMGYFRTML